MAKVSASGPARSSGRTDSMRPPPSPSGRPPTRSATACAVRPPAVTRLAARFELLDDALGQIQGLIRRDNAIVGGAHVENHGVVPRCPDSLDDAVDLALDGVEQLPLPGCRLLLEFLGALFELLLLRLKILALGGPLRRAQHDGLLIEVGCG